MAEHEWQGRPERGSLRRALRHALRRRIPELRVVAEDFLSQSTPIDLLGVAVDGGLVSIRIGHAEDEASLFVAALADLSWLRPRARDWLKLAPGLGIEASAEPKAMIFCPRFQPETRAAAANLPDSSIELMEYRCLRQHGQLSLLLESGDPDQTARPADDPGGPCSRDSRTRFAGREDARPARRARLLTDPPSPTTFRTGLTDEDLRPDRSTPLVRS